MVLEGRVVGGIGIEIDAQDATGALGSGTHAEVVDPGVAVPDAGSLTEATRRVYHTHHVEQGDHS